MKRLWTSNRLFARLFIFFTIIGATLSLLINKGEAILFLNNYHSFWGDLFFKYATKLGEEPLYIFGIILFLFVKLRHAVLIPLTGVVVLLSSYYLKSYFAVFRPATFFKDTEYYNLIHWIEGVDLYVEANSFPSGHTMSAFALYGLMAFLLPFKNWMAGLFFSIASIVGLSRVYLVQHFFVDVYAGMIIGILIAVTMWWIQDRIFSENECWWNQPIQALFSTKTKASNRLEKTNP